MILEIATILISSYLLGSIPTSVWISKIFFKKDLRNFGSGNAGATNTFRILGVFPGIIVLLIDATKGWFAVKLIDYTNIINCENDYYLILKIGLGLLAVVGHIFPLFAGFRGGKGVATLMGMFLAITLYPALTVMGVFIVVLLISRYVSVSSMLAGLTYPFVVIFFFGIKDIEIIISSVLVALLLLYTHRTNISRLSKGNESRVF